MAVLQEYKCPCCDGAIEFNTQAQKMKCPYCATEFDPETLASYKEELEKRFRIAGFGASTMSIDEILSRLVTTLENMYSISSKAMLKTDVAIVFTKCDIPGLDEIIGKKAFQKTHIKIIVLF